MPFTSGSRVTGKVVVGLETHLTDERRLDFTLVATTSGLLLSLISMESICQVKPMESLPWEAGSAELGLEEELGVEDLRGRVEGNSWDGGVDEVGSGDGVTGGMMS